MTDEDRAGTTTLARQDGPGLEIARADQEQAARALQEILATGDLSKLSNQQRVAHYLNLCHSLSLNPLSRPFDWLVLDGKLVLYPNKSCAEQLRRQHQISVKVVRREVVGPDSKEPMFVVEVEGRTPSGRTDEATKYVPLMGFNKQGQQYRLSGQALANAYAKAETGAKRRLVLSMVGLASPPDPDEVSGRVVIVDGRGNVLENPSEEQRYLALNPGAARAIGEPIYEDTVPESALLADMPDQRVRPEELERRARPERPRATFGASDEDVKRWLGAWFAAVKDTSLDNDEARHDFVASYTAQRWPEAKQTASLRTFFKRCTEPEARDFLAYARGLIDVEKAGQGRLETRPPIDPKVHAAAVLTGAPAPEIEYFNLPPEPDWGAWEAAPPKRTAVLAVCKAWTQAAEKLDPKYEPPDLSGLPTDRLITALGGIVGAVERVHTERFGDQLVDAF